MLVAGHLGCFDFLAIVKRGTINMANQVSGEYDTESLGHMLRSAMGGSHGRFLFSVFENSPL